MMTVKFLILAGVAGAFLFLWWLFLRAYRAYQTKLWARGVGATSISAFQGYSPPPDGIVTTRQEVERALGTVAALPEPDYTTAKSLLEKEKDGKK